MLERISNSSGTPHAHERAIGRSRGGLATKIPIAADAHGNPIDFKFTGGNVSDFEIAPAFIKTVGTTDYLIAEMKTYLSQETF